MQSKYSIKDLEHLSGIKAHTIRAWESRYGLIEPFRTETNIRYYVDEHLRKILNTSVLVQSGVKISKIAQMTDEEISQAVMNSGNYESNYSSYINSLKIAMLDFDEYAFDSIVSRCIVRFGADKALLEVVGPFIKELGVLWQINGIKVSHEHFASNLLRLKLFALIEQNMSSKPVEGRESYILYLPAGELHELSLLYLYYQLVVSGSRVVYLGQSVPIEYLGEVSQKTGIKNFISIFTTKPHLDDIESYLIKIDDCFPNMGVKFLFSGQQLHGVDMSMISSNVLIFSGVEDLKKAI